MSIALELLRVHLRDFPPGVEGDVFVARTGEPLRRDTFRAWSVKPSFRCAGLPYAFEV